MIFPGKQESVWSYDRAARAWYMHRFYPHQPDLNINNPLVRDAIHKVIGFWLELGLSGFRIDAVPFLIEQADPDNPAVSDPHDYLRDLHDFAVRRRGDTMLLAEANEPIDKLAAFFGERADEMDMLFSFVVNQALYLSFVRHDATPVTEALRSLPRIPQQAQWANFIKNHDEASLDKLSDSEREEVYAALAPKRSMRLFDRGIRRRFPTMVDGDRRRVELAYSLLFSLPGTPVLFYGEEIGLGENLDMTDREAVRPPMPWSDDASAGFSEADESKLPRRPVRDGAFGYRRLNVEAQRHDPGSLLNWMERTIRTRKEWPVIGWGEWRVLGTRNPRVLALAATWQGTSVLAVHSFSDATGARDCAPAERPGRRRVAPPARHGRRRATRTLDGGTMSGTLSPYGYHWFGSRDGRVMASDASASTQTTSSTGLTTCCDTSGRPRPPDSTRRCAPIIGRRGARPRASRASRGHGWGPRSRRPPFSFGVVNAPGQRYHPAIVAQAAATLSVMYPGPVLAGDRVRRAGERAHHR